MVQNLHSCVQNWQPMVQYLQLIVENLQSMAIMFENLQSMIKVVENLQTLWKLNSLYFNNFRIDQQISEVSMGVRDSSGT